MRCIPLFLLILVSFVFYCCSPSNQHSSGKNVYYIVVADTVIVVYQYNNSDIPIGTIPAERQFIIKDINQEYQPIEFGSNKGFVRKRLLTIMYNFKPSRLKDYVYSYRDSTYTYVKGYNKGRSKSSETTSSGGTVQVKGYYRKDGTYVQPYTRRSPSKKN